MCPSPQEKIQVESCSKGEFTNEKVDAWDGRTITQFEESSQDFVVEDGRFHYGWAEDLITV